MMMICLKNTSTQYVFWNICYNRKSLLFQRVASKIYAIIKTVYWFNWLLWTSTWSGHWEVFLETNLNQKTLKLYTSWVHWKHQYRSTIRKHAVMEQAWISTFCWWHLLKISLNHFMALITVYILWDTSESQRFPDVFMGIERNQYHEMV